MVVWIIFILIILLVADVLIADRRAKDYDKWQQEVESKTVRFLTSNEVKQIVSDWAKAQNLDIPPERVWFWKNRYEVSGVRLMKEDVP